MRQDQAFLKPDSPDCYTDALGVSEYAGIGT